MLGTVDRAEDAVVLGGIDGAPVVEIENYLASWLRFSH
jgi:hypothetical protein